MYEKGDLYEIKEQLSRAQTSLESDLELASNNGNDHGFLSTNTSSANNSSNNNSKELDKENDRKLVVNDEEAAVIDTHDDMDDREVDDLKTDIEAAATSLYQTPLEVQGSCGVAITDVDNDYGHYATITGDDEHIQYHPRLLVADDEFKPKSSNNNIDMHKDTTVIGIPSTNESHGVKKRMRKKKQQMVNFQDVEVREFKITIGDNPCCSRGAPLTCDWDYEDIASIASNTAMNINDYENAKLFRTRRQFLLTHFQRRDRLYLAGHTLDEIKMASDQVDKERRRRQMTVYLQPIYRIEETILSVVSHQEQKHFRRTGSSTEAEVVELQVRLEHSSSQLSLKSMAESETCSHCSHNNNNDDVEVTYPAGDITDSLTDNICHRESKSTSSASSSDGPKIRKLAWRNPTIAKTSGGGDHDGGEAQQLQGFSASFDSNFDRYTVQVDHGQHDMAKQIVLCNMDRPHMRAFHGAWISFFVAFFMWFAITPLLSEIQESLKLSREDIWTSTIYGAIGTILMRIMMGPICDKFGGRISMAFILVISSVPAALTGLIQTSNGLNVVRFFTGIAGSSFVACQYWSSCMFTREVAGTANALVAGWGNLGGGITQVVVGSVLFPLLHLAYDTTNNDNDDTNTTANAPINNAGIGSSSSSEKAWRTVFVFPALLSILTAFIIVKFCDDSPKGAYSDRIRQQDILIVSPLHSLIVAASNFNTWIMMIQYACCFGVEVTMTNATALYYIEEHDQTTVSAAAIASIFGIMNLFCRGLVGGGMSDYCNSRWGMRGRVFWQSITLLLEGISIVIFALANGTLIGSIFALIFTSIMVQSAEGSTFGIVPYVDRRFTGSAVGWVGAGGNVGGLIFAFYFRQYPYQRAFIMMGITASASSCLSYLINIKNR